MDALFQAIQTQDRTRVRQILKTPGLNINTPDGAGYPILEMAVLHGTAEIVSNLLQTPGLDVNSTDPDGNTALLAAVDKEKLAIVKLLLAHPTTDVAKANVLGETAIFRAVERNAFDILKEINNSLPKHPDVGINQQVNENGFTALIYAILKKRFSLAQILLRFPGIDVNLQNTVSKRTALMWALYLSIDMGVIYKDVNGVVQALLHRPETNMNLRDANGDTALLFAIEHMVRPSFITDILARNDTDINLQDSEGQTALHRAIIFRDTNIAVYLINRSTIQVNRQDSEGRTPLMLAVVYKNPRILKALLKQGADKSLQDAAGQTAIEYARKSKNEEILELLAPEEVQTTPWKGFSKADIEIYNELFTDPQKMRDVSFCPICLGYVEHMDACKMMTHKCEKRFRHERLYTVYKDVAGKVQWCTICGRPSIHHQHLVRTNGTETTLPNLAPVEAGANVFKMTEDACRLEGGGGFSEKLGRLKEFVAAARAAQAKVGLEDEKVVRTGIVEAAWTAKPATSAEVIGNSSRATRKRKRGNAAASAPAGLNVTAFPNNAVKMNDKPEASAAAAPNVDSPNPDPVVHTEPTSTCMICGDSPATVGPLVQFRHEQPDGTVVEHTDQYLCKDDLTQMVRLIESGKERNCPIDTLHCKGAVYPADIRAILGADTEVFQNYRRRFNEASRVNRNVRPRIGGGDRPYLFHILTESECVVRPKRGGKRCCRLTRKTKRT